MQAEELRAAPGAAEGALPRRPGRRGGHAARAGHARRGRHLQVETGRALADAGPAPRDRRRRHAAVLGRHAAGGAGRLRGRHDARGRDRRWSSRSSGTVTAEGDLDFRGTLGVDREAPVGFRAIRLRFDLDTDADDEQLDKLLELTERYCVVLQTLAGSAQLQVDGSGEAPRCRRCEPRLTPSRPSSRRLLGNAESTRAAAERIAGRRTWLVGIGTELARRPSRRVAAR